MKKTIISITAIGIVALAGGFFLRTLTDKTAANPAGLTANVTDTIVGKTPIAEWADAVSPAVQAMLEDAYQAFFINYTTPAPEKIYVSSVACTAQIVEQAIAAMTKSERDGLAEAYTHTYEAQATTEDVLQPNLPAGTITPAIALVVQEYFAPRLREETTEDIQSKVLERLIEATGGNTQIGSFSKKDCAELPVPAQYR